MAPKNPSPRPWRRHRRYHRTSPPSRPTPSPQQLHHNPNIFSRHTTLRPRIRTADSGNSAALHQPGGAGESLHMVSGSAISSSNQDLVTPSSTGDSQAAFRHLHLGQIDEAEDEEADETDAFVHSSIHDGAPAGRSHWEAVPAPVQPEAQIHEDDPAPHHLSLELIQRIFPEEHPFLNWSRQALPESPTPHSIDLLIRSASRAYLNATTTCHPEVPCSTISPAFVATLGLPVRPCPPNVQDYPTPNGNVIHPRSYVRLQVTAVQPFIPEKIMFVFLFEGHPDGVDIQLGGRGLRRLGVSSLGPPGDGQFDAGGSGPGGHSEGPAGPHGEFQTRHARNHRDSTSGTSQQPQQPDVGSSQTHGSTQWSFLQPSPHTAPTMFESDASSYVLTSKPRSVGWDSAHDSEAMPAASEPQQRQFLMPEAAQYGRPWEDHLG